MVSTAMMEPRRLSWRSVTDAMPTPRSRTMREALMLWLNFLFRKMVSKTMVKGMMANLVIW
jgi:hypothetical protein